METTVKDIVNAGIGTLDTIKLTVENNSAKLQNYIGELKEKGATVNTDTAQQVRTFTDEVVASVADYQTKMEAFLTENQAKLTATLEKYNVTLPELNTEELKTKVDGLLAEGQAKVDELRAQLEASVAEAQTQIEKIIADLQGKKDDEVQAA